MEQTGLWILNGVLTLLAIACGFVIRTFKQEQEHAREKISKLFAMHSDLRVELEKSKAETGKAFVTKQDFSDFKSEIFERFDKTDKTLENIWMAMSEKSQERKR